MRNPLEASGASASTEKDSKVERFNQGKWGGRVQKQRLRDEDAWREGGGRLSLSSIQMKELMRKTSRKQKGRRNPRGKNPPICQTRVRVKKPGIYTAIRSRRKREEGKAAPRGKGEDRKK